MNTPQITEAHRHLAERLFAADYPETIAGHLAEHDAAKDARIAELHTAIAKIGDQKERVTAATIALQFSEARAEAAEAQRDALIEKLKFALIWLHAAYDRPPMSPKVVSMFTELTAAAQGKETTT